MKPPNQPKMEWLSSDLYRSHAPRGNAAIPLARSTDKNLSSAFCLQSSERGISLIELVMYIVIVSVAMAGILQVLNANSAFSADPFVKKQARTVAESLLEEIELQDFLDNGFSGLSIQANRASFDDIMDYNGFATTGVYPATGTVAVSGLESYNVSVVVLKPLAADWGNIPAAKAAQITVVVTDPLGQPASAIGYRVDY